MRFPKLLVGGVDLHVVNERIGHRKFPTTERCLHPPSPPATTALEALNKIRTSQEAKDTPYDLKQQLGEARVKIAELQAALVDQLLTQNSNSRSNLRSV